jgi:hypothetical protein
MFPFPVACDVTATLFPPMLLKKNRGISLSSRSAQTVDLVCNMRGDILPWNTYTTTTVLSTPLQPIEILETEFIPFLYVVHVLAVSVKVPLDVTTYRLVKGRCIEG